MLASVCMSKCIVIHNDLASCSNVTLQWHQRSHVLQISSACRASLNHMCLSSGILSSRTRVWHEFGRRAQGRDLGCDGATDIYDVRAAPAPSEPFCPGSGGCVSATRLGTVAVAAASTAGWSAAGLKHCAPHVLLCPVDQQLEFCLNSPVCPCIILQLVTSLHTSLSQPSAVLFEDGPFQAPKDTNNRTRNTAMRLQIRPAGYM